MLLKDRLAREIALTGPMTVADYVTRCLHDPEGGYYTTRPAIGAAGDFITAPMISQMFGELLGLCLALAQEAEQRSLRPNTFGVARM